MNTRRLAIAVPSLAAGGAERAASALAGHLARRGHRVVLITLSAARDDFYALDPLVSRVALAQLAPSANRWRALFANRARIAALRAALRSSECEALLSFTVSMNVLASFAARPLGVPCVLSERVDLRAHPLRAPWRTLGRHAYRRAALVSANSRAVSAWLRAWVGHERVCWIPNLVEVPATFGPPDVALPSGPFVLALGRLEAQKGHADLVRAFAALERVPEWSLVLVGEGSLRAELERLGSALGLGARLRLPGRSRNPWALLERAELFAQPSHYEGFPNALLEAMALGKACVATDTGTGACELLANDESGWLVPAHDARALQLALVQALAEPERRARLGAGARATARDYAPELVVPRWEAAVERVLARPRISG